MTLKHSNINLLDENAWRRACFLRGFQESLAQDGVSIEGISSAADLLARAHGQICVIVLGGTILSSPAGLAQLQDVVRVFDGPVAVLTDVITADCISVALENDLRAILSTGDTQEIMQATLRFIMAGGTYFPHARTLPPVPSAMAGYLPPPVADPAEQAEPDGEDSLEDEVIAGLTRRQRDVAVALAIGASNKEIARELNLSEATVKSHVRQIMRKFDVTNRTQVALRAQMVVRELDRTAERRLISG